MIKTFEVHDTDLRPAIAPTSNKFTLVVLASVVEEIHRIAEAWGTTGEYEALKKIYEMTENRSNDGGSEHE